MLLTDLMKKSLIQMKLNFQMMNKKEFLKLNIKIVKKIKIKFFQKIQKPNLTIKIQIIMARMMS